MLSIPLIPTVQSIEVEKEVKNLIQEKQKLFGNIQGIIDFLKSKFFKKIVLTIWIVSYLYTSFMLIGTVLYANGGEISLFVLMEILQVICVSPFIATILTIYTLLLPFTIVINLIKIIAIIIISKIQEILDFINSIINPSYQANIT